MPADMPATPARPGPAPLHLVKLCVGAESVEDLRDWHRSQRHRWPEGRTVHVTRMWPRRADEILAGGSLYWIIKGIVQVRQPILALNEVTGGDGIRRCAIELDARLVRTEPAPRRPFQGWRYLPADEAPRDLPETRAAEADLPPTLAAALADIGLR